MIHDTNDYWEQLERLEKLIRASELKAGVVFSFHSLILGIFVEKMDELEPFFLKSDIYIVLSIIWITLVLISIFYCFLCFKPHIEMKYDKNVFFFRDAVYAFGNIEEFRKTFQEICANEEEITARLAEQIHAESKIIDQKFKCVHNAIKFFGLSFLVIILTITFWVIRLFMG